MRKALLLACVAAAPNLVALPAAHAHQNWHYEGGCGMATLSNGTDYYGTLWDGFIWVTAAGTDSGGTPAPTSSVTVDCELRINGQTSGTIVFACSTPGTGFVSCAGHLLFNADPDDIVSTCDLVTVNGEHHKNCEVLTMNPVVPIPVADAADIFTHSTCDEVASFSGGPLDQPPAFDIRPDGNIYAFDDGVHVWHCPTPDYPRRRYYAFVDYNRPILDLP